MGILSKQDIADIEAKYSTDVTSFLDICDKYDFDECEIWLNYNPKDKHFLADRLVVRIDQRIDPTTESFMRYIESIIGSGIVKGVIGDSGTSIAAPGGHTYTIFLYDDSVENLPNIVLKLANVPGILCVACYTSGTHPGASAGNDYYYDNPENWGVKSIYADKVWDFTRGSSSVHVGVVDSGIYVHPDLVDNLVTGYDSIYESSIVYDDATLESNYIDIDHGTMVAGVLGAKGNNSIGMCGVCWNVSMIPLRVQPPTFSDKTLDDIPELCAQAITFATRSYLDCGYYTKILNISILDYSNNNYFQEALESYSGLIVYSSGNQNKKLDDSSDSFVFSEEQRKNIIVVGALDSTGNRWCDTSQSGSNYGNNKVDIYAPGVNILTTKAKIHYDPTLDFNQQYTVRTGTSFAAPFVSGVAALLLSVNPELTAAQLKECIIEGADTITVMVEDDNGNDVPQEVKKLNAWGAFKYLMDNYYTFDADEIYSIGTSSIQFNDEIQSTNDYSTFKTNTSFIKINIQTAGHYNFAAIADNDIKVALYDSSYELITERSTYATSQASADFLCYLQPGTYYLKTNFIEEITGDGEIDFTVNYTQEDHQATRYLLYSSTHHRCVCECGELVSISPHTVKLSEVILGIGHCMYCGARVMLDDTIVQVPGINNVSQVTLNGSYILPNGIIVLVDSDIEAYEGGTLVFYDKDDLPVVQ